jgi:hypothetical protein
MLNIVPLPVETRAILNAAYRAGVALGRKFEATDLTFELRQAAHIYAGTYECRPEGDDFMRDMVAKVAYHQVLSDGQAKGILNVLMADARRRMAAKTPQAPSAPSAPTPARAYLTCVPDGRYRVTQADGEHMAIRLGTAGKESKLAGNRVVSIRQGEDWVGVAHLTELEAELKFWRSTSFPIRARVRAAIDVLDQADEQNGWLIAGLAFAQEGSQCFICGRDLDTPESLTAGYGPVCAEKNGLPWGAKAVPMSVRLAQAGSSPPAAEPEPQPETCVDQVPPGAPDAADTSIDTEAMPSNVTRIVDHTAALARGYARTYTEIFGDD